MKRIKNFVLENKKRIINIFIYFLGIFALKGVSLILTPLYTRVFTTAEYGTVELANSIVSFLGNILGLGLCQYLGVEYFHFKDDQRNMIISKNIKMFLYTATPIAVLIILLNETGILSIRGLDKRIVILIVLVSYLTYFSNLCLMLCKNQQKTTMMMGLQLAAGITTLALNLIGVCVLRLGIYSTLIATSISYIVLMLSIPHVYKFNISFKEISIRKREIQSTLMISIPLAVTGVVHSILILGDRWVLNYYTSTSEIGIYSLATKFGSIFELIIVNTLTIFYAPHVYKSYQEMGVKGTEEKNRSNFKVYLLIGFVTMIAFVILVKWVFPILIDNRYAEAEEYLWIILVGEIFLGATYFKTYLINYKKRTKLILFINVVSMIFNLLANIIFVPRYKIWAAASTTAGAYILMFFVACALNKKIYQREMKG